MTLVPCWQTPDSTPAITNGPARVWTTRVGGITTVPVGISCSARFFQEAGISGQPLAKCSTPCTSAGMRFETLGSPSWLQVDLIDSVIADAGWATSYPGPPDLESLPPSFTPTDYHVYFRARVGLFGSFVETWFKIRQFNPSNTVFLQGYDVTLQAEVSGYVEVEKWQQSLFYDKFEDPVAVTCISNDDIGNGPTGQRAERWNRVTFVHLDIVFSGADIAPGFPATGTLEFGTAGGSGSDDSAVTAYPYPELTLTPSSVAYASAQAVGNTVSGGSGLVVEGRAQATGASCPFSRINVPFGSGHITQDATTGQVKITNPENPGSNNLVALLMNQDGPITLSFNGSVKRLDQPMTPVPVEFRIPALSSLPEGEFHMGDMAGGFSFSHTWPQYVVREGRVGTDPTSAVLAQSTGAPESPTAHIELSQPWMHNPNWRSYLPGSPLNSIDIVNDALDYRILSKGDVWDAMTLEHLQSLAIPGTWTGGGDAVLSGGKWSSASGTGYLVRTVSPTLDSEHHGKLKLTLTTDTSPRSLSLWVNKKTFDTSDGHEGKQYQVKTETAGVAYDNRVNLCIPLNPLANTDEDSLTPPYVRTPDPGRDLQQSRWRVPVYKFGSTDNLVLSDDDGPYWGIGGGLTELRIEGLAAGELYTVGEPTLIVDKTDTVDMVAGNGNFYTHRDVTDINGGVFGFTGLADEKQSGDWPHLLIGTDATAETFGTVSLDPAGIDQAAGTSREGLHVCTITDLCAIINTSPAWVATPAVLSHPLNNADRPAACLNGMGALGGWNTDLTGGAVTVQACQMWDSIFDQGGSVDFEFVKVIGAGFAGVIGDGAGGPNTAQSVDEYAQTDPLGVLDTWTLFGAGDTNSEGAYKTGIPFLVLRSNPFTGGVTVTPTLICRDLEPSGIGSFTGSIGDPAIAVLDFQPLGDAFGDRWQDYYIHRRRWRGAFRDPIGGGNLELPWNLETEFGQYHRTGLLMGDVRYWRADAPTPGPGWTVAHLQITSAGNVTSARFEQDCRGNVVLLYADATTVYELLGTDSGLTWSAPTTRFTGTWPTIKRGGERLLRACYAGGNILMNEQYDGDASPSSNWTLADPTGTALSVENDGFHLAYVERRSGGIWYLHVRIAGEGHTSGWQSSDCRTWTRLGAGWEISAGKHPTLMAGRVFGEVVWAAFVAGELSCLLDYGGDTAPAAFTATGIALADDIFSIAEAYEHAGRTVIAAVKAGDVSASESTSPDEGVSWQAV